MNTLSKSMPFLLTRLGVRMGALFSQRLASYDLTLHMYRVLASLAEVPNQKLGELSAATAVELSTMSRLIGSMRAKDLVSRERHPTNDRSVQINLTQKGAQLEVLLSKEATHYEDVVVSTLNPGEIDLIKEMLTRMYISLDTLEDNLTNNAIP